MAGQMRRYTLLFFPEDGNPEVEMVSNIFSHPSSGQSKLIKNPLKDSVLKMLEWLCSGCIALLREVLFACHNWM